MICTICYEEMDEVHECFSSDTLNHSLELDILGLTNELLEPYSHADEPEHYDFVIELEYSVPLRVSEPSIPPKALEPDFPDLDVPLKPVPLFLRL